MLIHKIVNLGNTKYQVQKVNSAQTNKQAIPQRQIYDNYSYKLSFGSLMNLEKYSDLLAKINDLAIGKIRDPLTCDALLGGTQTTLKIELKTTSPNIRDFKIKIFNFESDKVIKEFDINSADKFGPRYNVYTFTQLEGGGKAFDPTPDKNELEQCLSAIWAANK